MSTPSDDTLAAAAMLPELMKAMLQDDSERVSMILATLYTMGPTITFAAMSTLAMIVAKHQLGDKFTQRDSNMFFGPGFMDLRDGSVVDSTQVEQAVAFAGQMVAAVANRDIEMEDAIFSAMVAQGTEMVAHVIGQLAADATKAMQAMFGNHEEDENG